ncbi:MAG: DinB family protein [Acidobacteriia bacterium]|nr:DinB family protein [Terriglobia bacterium]
MKKLVSLLLLTFLFVAAAQAQQTPPPKPAQPPTFTQILDRSLGGVEGEFVPAAEAMPEDKYSFAPANGEFKGVRNFGQQVRHVAAANYMICAAIASEKPPVDTGGESGPESIKTKSDSVKFLKDSYAYCHKAYGSINESNSTGQVQSPFGSNKVSRLGLAVLNVGHNFDHYGQMVEYLRMNGIIPPASRGQ